MVTPLDGYLQSQLPIMIPYRMLELDVSGNSLSYLPDELGAFTSLLVLKLNDNRLSGSALIPLSRGMPGLRELSLSKNLVTYAPAEVAGEQSSPTHLIQLLQSEKSICK